MNLSTFLVRAIACAVIMYVCLLIRLCVIASETELANSDLVTLVISCFLYSMLMSNYISLPMSLLFVVAIIYYKKSKNLSFLILTIMASLFLFGASQETMMFSEMNFQATLYSMAIILCLIYMPLTLFFLRKKRILFFT